MAGFEPVPSSVGNDRPTNCAIAAAPKKHTSRAPDDPNRETSKLDYLPSFLLWRQVVCCNRIPFQRVCHSLVSL